MACLGQTKSLVASKDRAQYVTCIGNMTEGHRGSKLSNNAQRSSHQYFQSLQKYLGTDGRRVNTIIVPLASSNTRDETDKAMCYIVGLFYLSMDGWTDGWTIESEWIYDAWGEYEGQGARNS